MSRIRIRVRRWSSRSRSRYAYACACKVCSSTGIVSISNCSSYYVFNEYSSRDKI